MGWHKEIYLDRVNQVRAKPQEPGFVPHGHCWFYPFLEYSAHLFRSGGEWVTCWWEGECDVTKTSERYGLMDVGAGSFVFYRHDM
jgi:hypothetical protein